jgi:hypothetical protein
MAVGELPNLGLTSGWAEGDGGWGDPMNVNLMALSVLAQSTVIDKVAATPGTPTEGDVYLFDETHATHPNSVAVYYGAAWNYFDPKEGWLTFNQAEDYYEKFDGTKWAELETGGSGGGVEEAPEDGKTYGRKDGDWTELTGGSGSSTKRWYAAGRVNSADGTPVIAVNNNIASVTRTDTGRFRITFATALPHTNFGVNINGRFGDFADNWSVVAGVDRHATYGLSVNALDINFNTSVTPGSTLYNPSWFAFEIYDPSVAYVGGGSGGSSLSEVASVTGTTYTVLAADVSKFLRFTGTTAKTVTVAPESTAALPTNGEWHLRNVGAGNITLTPGSGVTLNAPAGGTLVVPPGGTVTLKRAAADVFDVLGQTVAA